MEALFGFLGVLLGALITIRFQRKSEIFNNRLKVYSDFIDGVVFQQLRQSKIIREVTLNDFN